MSKSYRLKMGHKTAFRRTIDPNAKKAEKKKDSEAYQLVFEPGQDYVLSDEELTGLEKEIEAGLLVPTDKDEFGRQRPNPKRPEHQQPVKKGPGGEEVPPEDQPPTKAPRGSRRAGTKSPTVGGKPGGRTPKGPNVGAKTEVAANPVAVRNSARAAKKASDTNTVGHAK